MEGEGRRIKTRRGKEPGVPARLRTFLGRQMWRPESRARTCRHVSARGCREGASSSLSLQRPPRFFQEASRSRAREGRPPAPGSRGSGSTRLLPRVPAPGTPGGGPGCGLAAGGARERAPRSSGTLPPDYRPHGCGASPGGGEGGGCFWAWAWGCCGRRLIPCPILECYSVTDNRVTRAAADVLTASIGRRNKEGRGPSAGLSQPGAPARSDWLPRFLGGSEGEEGTPAAARNAIAVVSWDPRGGGSVGPWDLGSEFPQGSWYCGGCHCGKQRRSKVTQGVTLRVKPPKK